MLFRSASELEIPIRYVGTGEGMNDVAEFDPQRYVAGLFRNSSRKQ